MLAPTEHADAKRYRDRAEECRRKAARALSEGVRQTFLDIATTYETLARESDVKSALWLKWQHDVNGATFPLSQH